MNRQSVMSALLVAASLVSASSAYAAPTPVKSPVNATFSKAHMVKFSLRNDSASPMKVRVGGSELTLAPGKPVDVKLATGETVTAVETSKNYVAGAVVATAADQLNGATVVIR